MIKAESWVVGLVLYKMAKFPLNLIVCREYEKMLSICYLREGRSTPLLVIANASCKCRKDDPSVNESNNVI